MNWQVIAKAAARVARIHRYAASANRRKRTPWLLPILVALSVGSTTSILALVGLAAIIAGAPASAATAALGIPPIVLDAYLNAQARAAGIAPDCDVPWQVIAGIWKVESDHATRTGHAIEGDGTLTPPLYGAALDGSTPGTATITDTDNGTLDGDPTWDRAVGPAQFLPGSWRAYGQDGNGDGDADPHNVYDAALATAAHLCIASPGDYTNAQDLDTALRRYNNSAEYVTAVAGWIGYYQSFQLTQSLITADGLYAFPLPIDSVTVSQLRRSHHDYPASDLSVPEGTPVYAAHPGTVTAVSTACAEPMQCRCGWGVHIAGRDGHAYTYCHGTKIAPNVTPGTQVTAGQLLMTSGNTGNSLAPHLHLQIRSPNGALICPQRLLEAWRQGNSLSPLIAPRTGCTY